MTSLFRKKIPREDLLALVRRMYSPELMSSAPVSQTLMDRLDASDLERIDQNTDEYEMNVYDDALPRDQVWLKLAIGIHHAVPGVLSKTGLSAAAPPPDIHAMARNWVSSGGSYGHADMIVDALATACVSLKPGMAGLDFGCSSGRVVRVLAAAFPDLKWYGCDPNQDAIDWASQNLNGVEFQVSPKRPPLNLADASLDFAFAISIWSHFGENAALAWFREHHRILKPGGYLLFTAHGWTSVAYYLKTKERTEEQLLEIVEAMLASDFWYFAEFAGRGDHGIIDPEWGTAFLTREWIAARLQQDWEIVRFYPGREGGNQDLYVLRRC